MPPPEIHTPVAYRTNSLPSHPPIGDKPLKRPQEIWMTSSVMVNLILYFNVNIRGDITIFLKTNSAIKLTQIQQCTNQIIKQ